MKHALGLIFVLAAGCSDDGGTGGDDVASFIGTWTYATGSTDTFDCDNDQLDETSALTGTFELAAGTMSDLILVAEMDDPCPALRYDVSGNVASAPSGQTCTETEDGPDGMFTITVDVGPSTFTLGADKISLTGSQTASLQASGDLTVACTISQVVIATKAGT